VSAPSSALKVSTARFEVLVLTSTAGSNGSRKRVVLGSREIKRSRSQGGVEIREEAVPEQEVKK